MGLTHHQAAGAYRRWEPPSFDPGAPQPSDPGLAPTDADTDANAHAAAQADGESAATQAAPEAPLPPPVPLPTVEEIEAMFEQARAEGHEAGLAEGRETGHTEGYEAGWRKGKEDAQREAERLASVVAEMDAALDGIDQAVAEEIVTMAIELARQMVRRTLADHPDAVADTVRDALQQMPHNQIRIHLHPDDVALVREHLTDQIEHGHHRIIEDDTLARGGCRLDAAGAELDATVHTRWRRILAGLGRGDSEWDD